MQNSVQVCHRERGAADSGTGCTSATPILDLRGEQLRLKGTHCHGALSLNRLLLTLVLPVVLACSPGSALTEEPQRPQGQPITVYKSPYCGCCAGWADYLEARGFQVSVHDRADLSDIKAKYGIGPKLHSCHTAVVEGYAIEGHVPADDIWRLLKERPKIKGLAAPGMPAMSPGMNSIEPWQPN